MAVWIYPIIAPGGWELSVWERRKCPLLSCRTLDLKVEFDSTQSNSIQLARLACYIDYKSLHLALDGSVYPVQDHISKHLNRETKNDILWRKAPAAKRQGGILHGQGVRRSEVRKGEGRGKWEGGYWVQERPSSCGPASAALILALHRQVAFQQIPFILRPVSPS